MKNRFLISTTTNIDCGIIQSYIDVVYVNVVIGTNIYADLLSPVVDSTNVFWGRYSDVFQKIYGEVKAKLIEKSVSLGANAIVGLSVGFDEILDKDRHAFMISATGTAVKIKYKQVFDETKKHDAIISSTLDYEIKKKLIINEINCGAELVKEHRRFLLSNPMIEIVDNLLDRYFSTSISESESCFIIRYFSILPYEYMSNKLYDYISSTYTKHYDFKGKYKMSVELVRMIVVEIINECNLFNPKRTSELVKLDYEGLSGLLLCGKEVYKCDDLKYMKAIVCEYDVFCEEDTINPKLSKVALERLNSFKLKTETLSELLCSD